MLPEQWQTFLEKQGGAFSTQNEIEFSSDQTDENAYLADLSYLGVLEVSGEDRVQFLQGQLTNDVNQLKSEHSHFSGYCTPKGRMLALFRIIPMQDKLLLLLPQELLPTIAKRLQMYVLMSKVVIEDKSTELVRVGLGGQKLIDALAGSNYELPQDANQVTQQEGLTWVKLADQTDRYLCIGTSDNIQNLWEQTNATGLNTADWKLRDIQAGLPQVYGSTSEAFIPQMQNLQVLDGINFKKGCYTGQEVVARMQYLGKLKRQMYRLEATTDTLPQPGDEIYSPSSSSGQGAGKIVDAKTNSASGQVEMLAVLEISSAESGALFLDQDHQQACHIATLPYSIETE